VEKGGASVDIRDDVGRTVIDWAKECKERKCYTGDPHEVEKIVQYLEERCVKTVNVLRKSDLRVSSFEFHKLLHKRYR